MPWISIVKWPEEKIDLGNENNSSCDFHNSQKDANTVVEMLEKDGFGGEGKVFPTETFVAHVTLS